MATNETPVRRWSKAPAQRLPEPRSPACVGTLEPAGFPRVLPMWFLWENANVY